MIDKEEVEARLKAAKTPEEQDKIIGQLMLEAIEKARLHPIKGLSTRNGPTLYQCLMMDRERERGRHGED